MPKKVRKNSEEKNPLEALLAKQNDLLQKNLIITLALSGVPQQTIRKILGVNLNTVTGIVKHLKKENKNG